MNSEVMEAKKGEILVKVGLDGQAGEKLALKLTVKGDRDEEEKPEEWRPGESASIWEGRRNGVKLAILGGIGRVPAQEGGTQCPWIFPPHCCQQNCVKSLRKMPLEDYFFLLFKLHPFPYLKRT